MGPPRDKQVALSTFSYVFSELVQYVLPRPFQLRASIRRRGDAATERASTSAQVSDDEDPVRRGARNESGETGQGPREARPRCVIPPRPPYEARAYGGWDP